MIETEAEWLACDKRRELISAASARASERKLRLFVVSCCRQIGSLLADERSRKAVDLGEEYADGAVSEEDRSQTWESAETARMQSMDEIRSARKTALMALGDTPYVGNTPEWRPVEIAEAKELAAKFALWSVSRSAFLKSAALGVVGDFIGVINYAYRGEGEKRRDSERALTSLIREIFGNPFRPGTFDPAWNTSTVVALAQGMYAERDFSAMPILADALQDAGCDNDAILTHCRGPGPHVRGCWVVDSVLRKS